MTTALARPVQPAAPHAGSPAQQIQRTAFYLDSQGQPLFAWLHQPGPMPRSDHGVILCPPIGYEQIHSHRSLRHLADALAQAGLPVLRFDYHGAGDSAGNDEMPARCAAWLANIQDAQAWMRRQLGCQKITLIGLRLGATLALQAAVEQAVDNLVLWAPVVKGRLFVREMKALNLTACARAQPLHGAHEDIEAAGFVFSKQTAHDLSQLDMLACQPACQRALIITRDDLPADTRLRDHLLACGVHAEQIAQPGYAAMMAEPHYTEVPHTAIASTVDWLLADDAATSPCTTTARVDNPMQDDASFLEPGAPQQRIRERIFPISGQPELFGILSEPPASGFEHFPLIVFVNAGSAYRVGPSRLYVLLARQLSAQGFRCLRMDLGGLGDSVALDPRQENDPYAAGMFRDIDLTLKHVQAHLGVRRVVLLGLCSGAYAAFQSAVQIANPVLVESVLINPLTFYWKEGMSLDASRCKELTSFHYYVNAALQPKKWLKLLLGQSQIGILGALKLFMQRWRLRQPSEAAPPSERQTTAEDPGLAHPEQEDLRADLRRVVSAGRQLACFFAKSDPGYSLLRFHAGRQVSRLCQDGKMKVFFIEDADHTFSARGPRQNVIQAICAYLRERYQK